MGGFPDPGAAAGCIPSLLRRVLGFGSLPTCPLDYFETGDEKLDGPPGVDSGGPTPGIVARLMGLESLPLVQPSPSANSRDSLDRHLEKPKMSGGMNIPDTYREDEDDEFYIFSFEYPRRSSEKCNKRKNKKKKKRVTRENHENVALKMDHFWGDDSIRESARKNEAKIEFETEGGSENLSPNSVLEFVEFPADDRQVSCSGKDSRLGNVRMRRTLSEELESCEKTGKKLPEIEDREDGRRGIPMKRNGNSFCAGKWRSFGIEVAKMSWVREEICRNKDHMKEIGKDISCEILSQLVDELITTFNNF